MLKDRKWFHFRHSGTFWEKNFELIFFLSPPPTRIKITARTNYDACGYLSRLGYSCDLILCAKNFQQFNMIEYSLVLFEKRKQLSGACGTII